METIQSNKLIAEFMGLEQWNESYYKHPNIFYSHYKESPTQVHFENLQYHTSWDWLMPVVQRIECTLTDNKYNSDNFFNVAIEVFECNINGVDTSINISHNAQTKIKATYEAVVEFIKEYNKQN